METRMIQKFFSTVQFSGFINFESLSPIDIMERNKGFDMFQASKTGLVALKASSIPSIFS